MNKKMAKETHNLELSTRHQLLDLNKNRVNFKLNFNVVEEENKHFSIIILTQKEVDKYKNLDDIEMKVAPGKISGTITVNDNIFDNYILLLKSNDNCKVKLDFEIEEIEPNPVQEDFNNVDNTYNVSNDTESISDNIPLYKKTWFWVVLFVLVLVIGYFGYNYIQNRNTNFKMNQDINNASKIPDVSVTENKESNMYEHHNSTYENLKEVGQ
jgi:hypothetical protein